MFKRLKEKLKASTTSATMGVAGGLVALGVILNEHPEVIKALVPEHYQGISIAILGVVVALARMRTLGK